MTPDRLRPGIISGVVRRIHMQCSCAYTTMEWCASHAILRRYEDWCNGAHSIQLGQSLSDDGWAKAKSVVERQRPLRRWAVNSVSPLLVVVGRASISQSAVAVVVAALSLCSARPLYPMPPPLPPPPMPQYLKWKSRRRYEHDRSTV